jgi:hypothetical protein
LEQVLFSLSLLLRLRHRHHVSGFRISLSSLALVSSGCINHVVERNRKQLTESQTDSFNTQKGEEIEKEQRMTMEFFKKRRRTVNKASIHTTVTTVERGSREKIQAKVTAFKPTVDSLLNLVCYVLLLSSSLHLLVSLSFFLPVLLLPFSFSSPLCGHVQPSFLH